MKILALLGSPHGRTGSTGQLLDFVLEGAGQGGALSEVVQLTGTNVLPCMACDTCHKTGTCAQNDDFAAIRSKILEANVLVLASPNYIFNVSAQMKAFMDRCCGVIHCMAFRGKYGASVVTAGGGGEEGVAEILNRFLLSTGVIPVGSVWATTGALRGGPLPEEIRAAARELGRTLVEAVGKRAGYPEAEEWLGEWAGRMKGLVESRKDEWLYEYEAWRRVEEKF
ncbi:MAG: flavodoxin family protein [Deltaproteobacteria bacterium]|nr:flavodoxin family protein [Deltaproteobacteria bacterium]